MSGQPTLGAPIDPTVAVHWWNAYGVQLLNIGEDGEIWVALGHVDPLRMIAAIRKASREQLRLGDDDTFGSDYDVAQLLDMVEHRRAYFGKAADEDGEDSWLMWPVQDEPNSVDVTTVELL